MPCISHGSWERAIEASALISVYKPFIYEAGSGSHTWYTLRERANSTWIAFKHANFHELLGSYGFGIVIYSSALENFTTIVNPLGQLSYLYNLQYLGIVQIWFGRREDWTMRRCGGKVGMFVKTASCPTAVDLKNILTMLLSEYDNYFILFQIS